MKKKIFFTDNNGEWYGTLIIETNYVNKYIFNLINEYINKVSNGNYNYFFENFSECISLVITKIKETKNIEFIDFEYDKNTIIFNVDDDIYWE